MKMKFLYNYEFLWILSINYNQTIGSSEILLTQYLIDQIMVISSFLFNIIIVFIFLLRAYERYYQERMLGFVFSVLFIPFIYVWVTNLIGGRDAGRLITGFPVIVFILYDYWYREIAKKKPRRARAL